MAEDLFSLAEQDTNFLNIIITGSRYGVFCVYLEKTPVQIELNINSQHSDFVWIGAKGKLCYNFFLFSEYSPHGFILEGQTTNKITCSSTKECSQMEKFRKRETFRFV